MFEATGRYQILTFDDAVKILEADRELTSEMLVAVGRGLGVRLDAVTIKPHSTRDDAPIWRGQSVLAFLRNTMSQRG